VVPPARLPADGGNRQRVRRAQAIHPSPGLGHVNQPSGRNIVARLGDPVRLPGKPGLPFRLGFGSGPDVLLQRAHDRRIIPHGRDCQCRRRTGHRHTGDNTVSPPDGHRNGSLCHQEPNRKYIRIRPDAAAGARPVFRRALSARRANRGAFRIRLKNLGDAQTLPLQPFDP
jgi:hypothetical protein